MSEKDEILAQLSQDMEENGKFGMIQLSPNDATTQFLSRLCVSYVENLKKNIRRFPNIPLIAAFSIFNPEAIPKGIHQSSKDMVRKSWPNWQTTSALHWILKG